MNYFFLIAFFIAGTMISMERNPLENRLAQIENNMRSAQQVRTSRENAIIEAIATTQLDQKKTELKLQAFEAVALDEFATIDLALQEQEKVNQQKLAQLEGKLAAAKIDHGNKLNNLQDQITNTRWAIAGACMATACISVGITYALCKNQPCNPIPSSEKSLNTRIDSVSKDLSTHKISVEQEINKKGINSANEKADFLSSQLYHTDNIAKSQDERLDLHWNRMDKIERKQRDMDSAAKANNSDDNTKKPKHKKHKKGVMINGKHRKCIIM